MVGVDGGGGYDGDEEEKEEGQEVGVHDDVPVFEWGEGGEGLEAVYCKAFSFLFLSLQCALRGCVVSDVTTSLGYKTKRPASTPPGEHV